MLEDRTSEFRLQAARRLAGEITEDQFKPLRLMNGLYLQMHAYMLRIAIPYGTLDTAQLRRLAHVARAYDKGYGHFTTRTNLQLHWIKLKDAPDAIESLAEAGLHAIQTSGNCIRNVTADPYARRRRRRDRRPRVWAEAIRQWSTVHPEFSYLPRKFKIAVTAADKDRAAIRSYDVGLHLRRTRDGELSFEVMVGGGPGAHALSGQDGARAPAGPASAVVPRRDPARVQPPVAARQHPQAAHQEYLVNTLGVEEFTRLVEGRLGSGRYTPETDLPRHRAGPHPRALSTCPSSRPCRPSPRCWRTAKLADPEFARFTRRNLHPHKAPGYTILNISLKRPGDTPGDATSEQMELVADLADKYSKGEVRIHYTQNLVLPHVKLADVPGGLRRTGQGGPGHGQLRADHRHHRLPGPGLLHPGQRPRDPCGAVHRPPLRRSGARRADRRAADQDLRLHQRLRPPSPGRHRHPGRG